MDDLVRFGVSIEPELIKAFDSLIKEKGYLNRSEAIRDLLRETLSNKKHEDKNVVAFGTITIVYDHHIAQLAKKLAHVQHDHGEVIISTTHIHIDHHHCMETIVVKGKIRELETIAGLLSSIKGVTTGKLTIAA